MKLAIFCTAVLLCSSEKQLLSKNVWKLASNNLSSKDDKKLNMVHESLKGISAYEDLKKTYLPENIAPWGFLKHLETENIVVPYGIRVYPPEVVEAAAAGRIEEAVNFAFQKHEKNKEMVPFVHCVSKCVDLSGMLQRARENRNSELLAFFVSANIDVHNFLNRRDSCGDTPLLATSDYQWARVLILLGADLEAKNGYAQTALFNCGFDFYERILKTLKLLLQAGANIEGRDRFNRTPIHEAVCFGNVGAVRLFLDAGADKDAKSSLGRTPLHSAVEADEIEIVKMLIEAGAKKNEKDDYLLGDMPIHTAAERNRPDFIELLVDEGADIEGRNDWNKTPLHMAVIRDKIEATKILIGLGANVEARDNLGRTPIEYSSNPEMNKLFTK